MPGYEMDRISDDNGSDTKPTSNVNSWFRIVIIATTTALALVFTWNFQSVGDGEALRFGYRVGTIKTELVRIEGLEVHNKTKPKEPGKKKNKKSSKHASIDTKTADAAGESMAIQKEHKTSLTKKKTSTKADETEEIVAADKQSGENEAKESIADLEVAWNRMSSTKRIQVENYRKEAALIINIHATHHAGTVFCKTIGNHGINGSIAPSFACMGDNDKVIPDPPNWCDPAEDPFCVSYPTMKKKLPWTKKQTGPFAKAIRPYFHFISWEFSQPVKNPLSRTDWEDPNVLSVIITRDPISRLLAGDHSSNTHYPGYNTGELDREAWWDLAAYKGSPKTDNFFLRILSGASQEKRTKEQKSIENHVREGVNRTTDEILELFPNMIGEKEFEDAKSLLDRFTIVLDLDCLDDGMEALRDFLWMDRQPAVRHLKRNSHEHKKKKEEHKKLPASERVGYDDVYEYLVANNKWDIALYEYSKTISLIRC